MAAYKEQLEPRPDGKQKHKGKKQAKGQINRLHRRKAKQDPEEAPKKKQFKGYEF